MEKNLYNQLNDNSRAEVIDWDRIENFIPEEFDDPDEPGSWKYMDPLTIIKMQESGEKPDGVWLPIINSDCMAAYALNPKGIAISHGTMLIMSVTLLTGILIRMRTREFRR